MLSKTVPARMDSLHEILAFISEYAEERRFTKESFHRLQLVVEEALVNVFLYAYPRGQAGEAEVRLREGEDGALEVEIRDQGAPFDPLAAAGPDLAADLQERKIGGLGIYFVRTMADGVRYRREAESNILGLTFFNL